MNRILFLCLIIVPTCMEAQSIYKTWYSEESNVCLNIDSSLNCVRINAFYQADCKRITFRIKDDKLKLVWRASQRIFGLGWRKDVYWLTIDKLTEEDLILTLLPNKNYILDDFFKTRTVKFISKTNCEFKFKDGSSGFF
jgi:hypothetical protein